MFKTSIICYTHSSETLVREDVEREGKVLEHKVVRRSYATEIHCRCGNVFNHVKSKDIETYQEMGTWKLSQLVLRTAGTMSDEENISEMDGVSCPVCESTYTKVEDDHRLAFFDVPSSYSKNKAYSRELFHVQCFDNRPKGQNTISLNFLFTEYFGFRDENEKIIIAQKNKRSTLTYNFESGFMYYVEGKFIRNITNYVSVDRTGTLERLHSMLNTAACRPPYTQEINSFANLCVETRGGSSEVIDRIGHFCGISDMQRLAFFLKHPNLLQLPYEYYDNANGKLFPNKQLKAIDAARNPGEMYQALTGHKSRPLMKLFKEHEYFLVGMEIGPLFNDSNVLATFLQKAVVIRRLENPLFVPNLADLDDVGNHFPAELRKQINLGSYAKAARKIRSLCPTDAVFMHRILNDLRTSIFEMGYIDGQRVQRKTGYRPFSINTALQYLHDILRDYTFIMENDPEFVLDYRNDFMDLHDRLARHRRRLGFANREINYTQGETSYNKKVGNIKFFVPKETDELFLAGEEMDICVASYSENVANRDMTVVLGYIDDEFALCIDASRGKLGQVKGKYNQIPNIEVGLLVKEWAESCNIQHDTSSDLRQSLGTIKEDSVFTNDPLFA